MFVMIYCLLLPVCSE